MIHDNKPALDELIHFGVKGMKWGVRKEYEPHPRDVASVPKKKSKRQLKLEDKYMKKGLSAADAEISAAKRAKIEKIIKVAGALTLTAATVYGGHKFVDWLKTDPGVAAMLKKEDFRYLNVSEPFKTHGIKDLSDIPKISGQESLSRKLYEINPHYDKMWQDEWYKNCAKATVAFEMRMRGYDVTAGPSLLGLTRAGQMSCWEGFKFNKIKGDPIKAIKDSLPENGRGIVNVDWKGFGNGSHAFPVIKINDRLVFLDGQNYDFNASRYFSNSNGIYFGRVDNLDFTDKILDMVLKRGG